MCPAQIFLQDEFWPLRTTHPFLLLNKSDEICISSPEMLFGFNLKISPLYQTLSRGLFYQGLTLSNAVVHLFLTKLILISYPLSKDVKISLLIDNSWLAQESRDLKPIWFLEIRLFLIVTVYRERRNWTIIFNILLNTFRELKQRSNFCCHANWLCFNWDY